MKLYSRSKSKNYSTPSIKSKRIKLNFFYEARVEDSFNNLLSAEIFLASSHGGGCGGGSGKDVEQPV